VKTGSTIRKILFVTLWVCIGGGMFILLMAAITKRNKGLCKDYVITIKGAENNFFIDQKEVELFISKKMNGAIRGELVSSFKLHELEKELEQHTWISKADLYFDNQEVLHINIIEKEPVARIFTQASNSFYIDSAGKRMPLSDKLSARLPVFTGFPDKKKLNSKDSLLLNDVRSIAMQIISGPFWMSQVAQIDITADRTFEMIPTVGNHVVKLGNGENIPAKLNRLMVFYKQVLAKTGFDKYKLIDVQYKGQVVASRYAGDPKVDSVQLRKNVEKLLKQSVEAEKDTAERILAPVTKLEKDSAITTDPSLQDLAPEKTSTKDKAENRTTEARDNKVKPASVKPVKKDKPKPEVKKQVPKAVMPKKPAEEENGGYN
jgi:cell division protein FtsQ